MCKSLGIFATAHADGKLYLRTLPNLEGGGGPTATIGEQPVQTLTDSPAAIVQVSLALGRSTAVSGSQSCLPLCHTPVARLTHQLA